MSLNWTVKEQVPAFAVADLELGIEFYLRLGFEVAWRWPKSGSTHVGLRLGPCALMLTLCDPAERGEIYYVVDDVLSCFESIVANRPWEIAASAGKSCDRPDCPPRRAIERPAEPSVKDHRHLDFTIVDPWGHQLTFGCEATS